MNQLQSLIHDALIGTGHVSQCAILRRKDGNLKASSVGFQVCHCAHCASILLLSLYRVL